MATVREGGALTDIAPTVLELMGLPVPEAHVELLQALADFIEKPENTEALRSASTVEEILRVVERGEGDA